MGWLASLNQALRFLTLLSFAAPAGAAPQEPAKSLYMFPVAGLLIGALAAAVGMAALYLFGYPVHAVAVVAALAVVTAGLHLDGLADTCDGLLSWQDRERRLEIMRDSRIGVMGAAALVLVLAFKIAALLALGSQWWVGALIAPAFGRWTAVYAIARFPAARSEGLAASVRAAIPGPQLQGASWLIAVIALPLFYWGDWYIVIAVLAAVCILLWWLASTTSRSLGGLTGDVYGALVEIGEVAALLAICVIVN